MCQAEPTHMLRLPSPEAGGIRMNGQASDQLRRGLAGHVRRLAIQQRRDYDTRLFASDQSRCPGLSRSAGRHANQSHMVVFFPKETKKGTGMGGTRDQPLTNQSMDCNQNAGGNKIKSNPANSSLQTISTTTTPGLPYYPPWIDLGRERREEEEGLAS